MQPSYPVPPPMPPAPRTSGMAIAGFVCSFFCGILGLVFSVMGRNECRRSGGLVQGEGLATAGMVISIINILLSVIGIVAAIAIPSYMEASLKKVKAPEAQVQLERIRRRAVESFIVDATFPQEAAPLTPAVDCCTQNASGRRKCALVSSDWRTPAWEALDFEPIADTYFQYSYEPVDGGRGFIARAVGDLDCDGTTVTWTLRGSSEGGEPRVELIEPPMNAD